MKSLEHIIRDIREGKCCCEKKKDSLENSIRKVVRKESSYAAKDSKPVDEDVAGMMGSTDGKTYGESSKKVRKEDGDKLPGAEDKMDEGISVVNPVPTGNQFKSVRTQTPHIKPPAGPGSHSQAPENVSRQRTFAKERVSQTMGKDLHAEETVEEQALPKSEIDPGIFLDPFAGKILGGASTKAGKPARKVEPKPDSTPPTRVPRRDMPKPANEPGKAPTSPVVPKPDFKPFTPPTREKPSTTPANVPAPATPKEAPKAPVTPKVEPAKPAPAMPTPAAPKEAPKEEPKTKPVPAETPAAAPAPATQPQPSAAPETKTPSQPAAATTPATAAQPSISTAAKTAAGGATAAALTKALSPKGRGGMPSISGGMPVLDPTSHGAKASPHKAGTRLHRARKLGEETRKEIENMPRKGDRKSIDYVGRKEDNLKTSKEKTSRLAIIKNVIDEAKKIQKEDGAPKLDKPTKVYNINKDDVLIINPDLNKNTLDTKEQ